LPAGFTYGAASVPFRRGEVDGEEGINQADALALLFFLFGGRDLTCLDAADVNDDGKINVSDAIVLLRHLFQGGAAPPEPYDAPGPDPTADDLGCSG
jgi:hypothetical protein